jgi:hypothetical protein
MTNTIQLGICPNQASKMYKSPHNMAMQTHSRGRGTSNPFATWELARGMVVSTTIALLSRHWPGMNEKNHGLPASILRVPYTVTEVLTCSVFTI